MLKKQNPGARQKIVNQCLQDSKDPEKKEAAISRAKQAKLQGQVRLPSQQPAQQSGANLDTQRLLLTKLLP
jgi:hypothetical protein